MKRIFLACFPILFTSAGLAWGQVAPNSAPVSAPNTSTATDTVVFTDPQPALSATSFAPVGWFFTTPEANSASRVYVGAEYLLWWAKPSPLPPALITTGPVTDNPGSLGSCGIPLTRPSLDQGGLSGVRVTLGVWLDREQCLAIETSGFLLPSHSRTISYGSDASGNPVLAFRHLDPPTDSTPAEDAFQASVPGIISAGPPQIGPYAGSVGLTTRTLLWGTEVNFVGTTWQSEDVRWQVLGGVRYLDLSENLDLAFARQAIPGSGATVVFQGNPYPDPSAVVSLDSFQTRNQFYGGQIGARGEIPLGRFFLAFTGKLAIGDLHESVNILGTSTLVQPGLPSITVPGGQFAAASNSGRATRDEFAVLPEMQLAIGCQVSRNLRALIGYDLLYLNRVARPGGQVDLIVDPAGNQIDPGFTGASTTYPRPLFNDANFWAQGLQLALEVSY